MSSLAKAVSVAILMGVAGQSAAADQSGAITRALNAIHKNPAATRTSAGDGFSARSVIVDRDGTEHVRMNRTYQGLPVIGGDLVVHSRAGVFRDASLAMVAPINIPVTPKLTASQAIVNAGAEFGTDFHAMPTARLAVYFRRAAPKLAYDVLYVGTARDKTPIRMHYFVDATSGAILEQENDIETGILPGGAPGTGIPAGTPSTTPATGSGRSLLAGAVPLNTQWNATRRIYELKDTTRGNSYINDLGNGFRGFGTLVVDGDNRWGNGTMSDRATVAVDAAYGFGKTWDYYKNAFGRLGIADDGVGPVGIVHYESNYNNAFWNNDCFCMSFGDGDGLTFKPLVAIDVMGHEMSHGVMHATADLAYVPGDTGGLNEANSDIMGTMVEFSANNSAEPGNYLIGETLVLPAYGQPALRAMFKPSLDGISDDCYPDASVDNGAYLQFFQTAKDPHFTSGVGNHFFYLLAEGAVVPTGVGVPAGLAPNDLVCNGNVGLTGIGRGAAQQIWYRAVTVYMTSTTKYVDARVATLKAAADLFGGPTSATPANYNAVAAAWDAVNVH